MAAHPKSQHTIRGVSSVVDKALRERSKRESKSINEIANEALERGLGVFGEPIIFDDMDDLIGTWVSDPDAEKALKSQRKVDKKLWL